METCFELLLIENGVVSVKDGENKVYIQRYEKIYDDRVLCILLYRE